MAGRTPVLRMWVTVLCGALLGALLMSLFALSRSGDELGSLRFPAESAGRMLDRHLNFYEGYDHTPAWERTYFALLFGSRDHVQEQAVGIYREVLAYIEARPDAATSWAQLNTRARLLVTLGETGQHEALVRELSRADPSLDEEVVAGAIRFAYLGEEVAGGIPEIQYGARLLPLGWASDRLELRLAEKLGYTYVGARASERLQANGERWRSRVLWLSAAMLAVLGAGTWVWLRGRRWLSTPEAWRNGALQRPWDTTAGVGVVVRAALLGLVIAVTLSVLAGSYFQPGVLSLWSSLIASVPMLWLMHRHLLRPRGLGFVSAFGLSLRGVGVLRFARITAAVLALEWSGSLLIAWLGWQFGLQSHWSDGVYERFIFGPWQTAFLGGVNLVLWAPVFEELGFRGLIYGTLRTRLRPWHAIVASALLFSALHLYSLVGFLAVLWSGLVLAWAYERFGSLLPGMVVHAAGNLLALGPLVLFYR